MWKLGLDILYRTLSAETNALLFLIFLAYKKLYIINVYKSIRLEISYICETITTIYAINLPMTSKFPSALLFIIITIIVIILW